MTQTPIETFFYVIDETATILKERFSFTYLEALIETSENLFQKERGHELDEVTSKRIEDFYKQIDLEKYSSEEIRKAFQLAVLKGMKEALQPNHAMTPDAVSLFISYLVNKWMKGKETFSLFDPVVGTGNLLTAVLNQSPSNVSASGIEADETLLKIAYVNANLQQHNIELFHGDSIQPLYIDPVDVVVADLPVGYYPNDEIAQSYTLKAAKGHSFVHHLLIEQSLKYTKEGGILIFLVPNFLFQNEEAEKLNKFIKEEAIIQGLLQLPLSMFKQENQAKSIFMIQKKGNNVKLPKQALLAELPSFSNQDALYRMMRKIDQWFIEQRM